jgi:metal-dependent amidase/aminoacylase/carboxypeptidase family protein
MIPGHDSHNGISGTNLITANAAKGKTASTRVLSTKVSEEDYGAYKIAADHLFEGSISQMIKIALRHYLRGQAVNDGKFEILKDAAKTGDHGKINDAFFVLKPKIVRFRKPREYGIIFE